MGYFRLAKSAAEYAANKHRGIAWYWKRGWIEYPEVMGAALIGGGSLLSIIGMCTFQEPRSLNRRYKMEIHVMRSDDPRLTRVRRYETSPEPTRV